MHQKSSSERVLSIQSHVVFGYVGGKCAVFPLQLLGYEVDVVNSVNYSNHAAYSQFGGSNVEPAELEQLFSSLEKNSLLSPTRLLTGYIPRGAALSIVSKLATRLKQSNPNLIYLLDPVLGDAGAFYVGEDVVPVYRSMLPLATIITPNWFEVETLTKLRLEDFSSLKRAVKILHEEYHVPNVVISSVPLQPWLRDALPLRLRLFDEDENHLVCISSSSPRDPAVSSPSVVHAGCVCQLPGCYAGVGDLFSALLLGHFDPSSDCISSSETALSQAVSLALTKTHAVVCMTYEYIKSLPEGDHPESDEEKDASDLGRKNRRIRARELRLVQSQDIIRGATLRNLRPMHPWPEFW